MDASQTGWGDFTGGCWSLEEKQLHMNALELLAATFGILQRQNGELSSPEVRKLSSGGLYKQNGRHLITNFDQTNETVVELVPSARN